MQVAASPTGALLTLLDDESGLHVFEWPSGKERPGFAAVPDPWPSFQCAAFLSGGRALATVSGRSVVKVWDVLSGKSRFDLPLAHESRDGLRWITALPGKDLVALPLETSVELVDLRSRSVRSFATSIGVSVTCLVWSPDGERIAAGGRDQRVELYDIHGRQIAVLAGLQGRLTALAFSPDGRTLVSGTETGEVLLWSAWTGQPLYHLRGHTGCVLDMAFTPDGTRLITAGATEDAKPWRDDWAWWGRQALVNGGREAQIRGEVFIWQAPQGTAVMGKAGP